MRKIFLDGNNFVYNIYNIREVGGLKSRVGVKTADSVSCLTLFEVYTE